MDDISLKADERTPLTKPSVTALLNEDTPNSINVKWGAVVHAGSYVVTATPATGSAVSETVPAVESTTTYEHTFSGLAYETAYTISVVAKPSDTSLYLDSAAGVAEETVTTGANPSPSEETTFELSGTFTSANSELSLTQNGITVVQKKVSGSTAVNSSYNKPSTLRVYKGHALSFSGNTIKKIEITVDGKYYGNSLTVDSGTLTPTTTSGGTIVWEGNASSVTITNVASASNVQLRPTSIKITFVE